MSNNRRVGITTARPFDRGAPRIETAGLAKMDGLRARRPGPRGARLFDDVCDDVLQPTASASSRSPAARCRG
jgi:hypothetical protein